MIDFRKKQKGKNYMSTAHRSYKNFSEILQDQAKVYPHKKIIQFVRDDHQIETYTYIQLHEKALSIAYELSQHYKVGDRAILLYPPTPEFIFAFWACIYAGIIPVPLALPLKNNSESLTALNNIIQHCKPKLCLTNNETYKHLRLHRLYSIFKNIPIINTFIHKLTVKTPLHLQYSIDNLPTIITNKIKIDLRHCIVDSKPEDILYLQYSTKNSASPKETIITHRKAIDNAQVINREFVLHDYSRLFVCMPHYHPMGLLATTLSPIYSGITMRFMSFLTFLQDPLCWLEKIHEFRADVSGGPTIAYDLCVRHYHAKRMQKIDLSAWSCAFCGTESGQQKTLDAFANLFAQHGFNSKAFLSCKGLDEDSIYYAKVSGEKIDKAVKQQLEAVMT